jgi:carboxyl-terminal processing protease
MKVDNLPAEPIIFLFLNMKADSYPKCTGSTCCGSAAGISANSVSANDLTRRHFLRRIGLGTTASRACVLLSAVTFAVCCTIPLVAQPATGGARPEFENRSAAATATKLPEAKGSFGGIGAKLQRTNGVLQIEGVISGGPADRAGLKAGQTITTINGVPVANIALEDAVKLLRGTVGSEVELTVAFPGSPVPRRIQMVREAIDVTGVKFRIIDMNVGLLTLTGFNEQTPGKVLDALELFTAKTVRGIVLDLRDVGNDGGLYSAACEVASYFVGTGRPLWLELEVGKMKAQPVRGHTDLMWPGSIVVLASTNTGGSSELLVAALKSNGRAIIMGQTTAGTACLRALEKQPDGTSKKVLRAHVFTVKNETIYGQGIKPDLPIKAGVPPEQVLSQGVEVLLQQK